MDEGHSFPILLLATVLAAVIGAMLVAVLLESSGFRRWRRIRRHARDHHLSIKFAPHGSVIDS